MRKLLFSLAGLALGGFIVLTPRMPLSAVGPQGGPAKQRAAKIPPAPMPALPGESPFTVKAKDGPWMICAANYTGPHAAYLAEQVVRQLRERKINAFVFSFADKNRRENEWAIHQHLKEDKNNVSYRPRFTRVEGHCAVLIGGFKTMEEARAALHTVVSLSPPDVRFPDGEDASDRFVVLGEARNEKTDREETKQINGAVVNPFERSFVIRNPEHQAQAAQKNEVDPAWKGLNSDEPYSLLKNKKNFTLVVKLYNAPSQYQSSLNTKGKENGFLGKIGLAGNTKGQDVLEATARQAHELARYLRHYKIDAYVLHMRHGSLVTVGSFATLEDPELTKMQRKIGTVKLKPQGPVAFTGQNQDAMFDPMQLLPNPMPMRVPKL